MMLRIWFCLSLVAGYVTLLKSHDSDEPEIDSYFLAAITGKLTRALTAAAQIHEASKTWTYGLLVDSNGISHYVFLRKMSGHLFRFVKTLEKQFNVSTTWKAALIDSASLVNYMTNLLTSLQARITDERYKPFGFSSLQIYKMYENALEVLDLAQQLEDHLLRKSLLSDLNVVFNHVQLIVEQTERYAPVVRAGTDALTLYAERQGRMLTHQRGCARTDGRLIPSKLDDEEVVLVASFNSSVTSWNNVVYYGQPVAVTNPKCQCFLSNADFDCYGTMAWDRPKPASVSEFFRFLHPDLSVSLGRPLRIGDRVVIQSQRDNTFVCPVDSAGTTRLLPVPTKCEFQVRHRNAQIPQI